VGKIVSTIILSHFTINSINHNHYDNASRQAVRDDGGGTPTGNRNYWLRSAGAAPGYIDAFFRPVASVNTFGSLIAYGAPTTNRGFRLYYSLIIPYNKKVPHSLIRSLSSNLYQII